MFPTGTLLFQASQPIRSGKDVPVSMNAMKHFLDQLGEKYSLQKNPETQHDSVPLLEKSVNEIV